MRAGLGGIAAGTSPLADEARWMAATLAPTPAPEPWRGPSAVVLDPPPDASGLVRAFAVLGPFEDTDGGGLRRAEGPEDAGGSWSDTMARFSWGAFEVAWQRVLPQSVTARGLPLDLYVSPRNESCSYLASRLTFPAGAQPVVAHVAGTGALRVVWDGADVAVSDEAHARLGLERISARIAAPAGEHLLAIKVCSAAVADEGRVRVRFTDGARKPVAVGASSDLGKLSIAPRPASQPAAPDKPREKIRIPAKPGQPTAAPAKPDARPPTAGKPAAQGPAAAPRPAIVPPKGIDLLPTVLSRALALSNPPAGSLRPTPSPAGGAATTAIDRLLTAIVVRTLGGADDARSPRAPGLLDRATREASLTPDALALAGWVSPFGANRSGWLNLARSRAQAAGDAETAAFAQRRLAAAKLGAVFSDWARAETRIEPLASARDPEARLIRAVARKHLGAAGLLRGALDELLAVVAEKKEATPTGVWLEIADLSRIDPSASLLAARRLAEVRAEVRGPAWVRAFRAVDGAAVQAAAAQALGEQTDANDLTLIGRELLDSGRNPLARDAFALAVELSPNRAPAYRGLAAALQAVAADETRAGKKPTADPRLVVAALARARDLEPSDAALRAELAFRTEQPASGEGTAPKDARERVADEAYIVTPQVFLARARANPARKGEVFDRQLHWVRAVTYHPDKRVSQLMHYAREIVVEPRTEQELVEPVPTESGETELLFARVHKKDGTVVQPEEQSSGGQRPFIRWPRLVAGDVVEVAVRSWTAGPVGRRGDAPFYFIDYVGSTDTHPVLYNEVVIDSPEATPLATDVLRGKADRVTNDLKDGRRVTRMIWDNPTNIASEPLAPQLAEALPVVIGSTFGSWSAFREWYRGAVSGFTEPDDQVRRLAAELTNGKNSEQDKIRALFEFVADDIRYVNYVSGEWWLPNRPQELLARRQGDCDDKALLLISLLKSVGIQATEVLVQTRYTGQPSLLKSDKVAIPMFDHGIAYLPGKNGKPGMWLDATSPQSRLGPLPAMDARAVALFIDEGPAQVVDTPAASPDDHGIDAEWTMKLGPSGAGELTARERHIGDAAFELRMNLRESDARSQWVEQYVAGGLVSSVELVGDIDFQGDLPGGAARLGYQAKSDGLARREGDELAVPIAETQTLTSQLAPLVKRTLPVVLPPGLAPGHQTRRITIVPPPNYTFGDLPPAGEEAGGEFGRAKLTFKRQGGSVVVERTVIFDLSTIPVDKYTAWRGWLQRVDRLMHRMVRLVPTGPAAKARDPLASQPAQPASPPPAVPQQAPGKALPGVPPAAAAGQPLPPPSAAPPSPPAAGSGSPVR
ncbi:MAG: transglutaminase-like domain-containing protein [Polyangiaceae bacterium]